MSLVGSLEDLALADILQIVSLARKSGLLLLRSEQGDGRIVFSDGLVHAAYAKGEPDDLAAVLIASGVAEADRVSQAIEDADATGRPREELLSERTGLAPERVESLRREHVERVVVRMFGWTVGEFSFDVREEIEDRDAELALSTGINAQFLSIEAARLGDESCGEGAGGPAATGDFVFSGEVAQDPGSDAREEPEESDGAEEPDDPHEVLASAVASAHGDADIEESPVWWAQPAMPGGDSAVEADESEPFAEPEAPPEPDPPASEETMVASPYNVPADD